MPESDAKPFRVLSLDGGGIRGAFEVGFLADLEQRLGQPIASYFDLIAGTSTGGIVACALALHEPAEKIEKFYREHGPKIFTRRQPKQVAAKERIAGWCANRALRKYGIDYDQLWQSKYGAADLRAALTEVFGDKKLEDAKTRLVIPAVDLTRGQTIVFKTPHMPGFVRDRHFRVVDVLLATTAAPTYFPHAVIAEGSAYVDGGLWANNPSMVAVAEVLRIREKCQREGKDFSLRQEDIYLLSVGTGRAPFFASPPTEGAGMVWWLPNLFNITSVSQSQGISFQAQYILGDRYHRIDYDLPNGRWSLDSMDVLDHMIHIGHERSTENLARLHPIFFGQPALHPYHPFPEVPDALPAGATRGIEVQ